MGAILAWLARWGRVLAGYLLIVAALVSLCNVLNSLIGYAIPNLLVASSLYTRIMTALSNLSAPINNMVRAYGDDDGIGSIIMYCMAFDGLASGLSLLVSMISAAVSVSSGILLAAFSGLLLDFTMRKTRWFGNAVAGVSVGGDK